LDFLDAPPITYHHRLFLRCKGDKISEKEKNKVFCRIFRAPRIVLVKPWLSVIQYGFSSTVPPLEYLFPLAVGVFKG
jgi:hypothetical protein